VKLHRDRMDDTDGMRSSCRLTSDSIRLPHDPLLPPSRPEGAVLRGGRKSAYRRKHVVRLRDILAVLDRSRRPDDMNLPGFRLHPLKGELKGHWAVFGIGKLARHFSLRGRRRIRRGLSGLLLEQRKPTMPMHDPPHPGGIVRRQCLQPVRLSVTEAAAGLERFID